MRLFSETIRGWLIPAALVATATLLTVPWSYWVIKAAYDRDVLDNAKSLARRVTLRVSLTPAFMRYVPAQASAALQTELASDQTVQLAAFYDLSIPVATAVAWIRE